MLVLSRKPGEKVVISGNIQITVLEVLGNRVRIGIQAPADVNILRGELSCWLEAEEASTQPDAVIAGRGEERARIVRPK
jgi:carbon storage regulator